MTDKTHPIPRGFAASVPGAGHIRYGTPCQDASGVAFSPRPAAIVCDGRGSSKRSHFGSRAAVKAFFSQLSILEPFLAGALDRETPPEKWDGLCRLLYRTLLQVKLDLAAEKGVDEKDFDFTVAFAVAGTVSIGCFQVGDGAVVLRQNGVCRTVFPPDKGEFANQTSFLRPGGEETGKYHARLVPASENTGIAVTSDGPEYLMFRQTDMKPGPIFGQMFDDLVAGELCEQDLRDYLTRPVWASDPRGADDRSIAVLLPRAERRAGEAPKIPDKPVRPEPVANPEQGETEPVENPEQDGTTPVANNDGVETGNDAPSVSPIKPMVARKAVSPWIAAVVAIACILNVVEAILFWQNSRSAWGAYSDMTYGPFENDSMPCNTWATKHVTSSIHKEAPR